ncbi:uncharacterized protein LOC114911046 [Scleropages formosus]|uniref:uncharacterized protein LOC114911046 n=1 Tax=Scleropages formosus TaxID=113540 RepID=UPI000631C7D7|nr:uncharacterized protein LOC114911046 [Scleropages formosus]
MTAMDVEALHPPAASASSRGARLRTCLLASVGALFVCVLGVSLAVTLLALGIQGELDKLWEKKVQSSAHLEIAHSHLSNITLRWTAKNLGSRFNYSEEIHALEVMHSGMYLMYLNLGVRCPHEAQGGCGQTSVAVSVNDMHSTKLECRMELPASHPCQKVHRCLAAVMLRGNQRLLINMKVKGDSQRWKLERDSTRFGLVPVDSSTA